MRLFLTLLIILNPIAALADIKTDKAAGNCVAYLAVLQKESGARDALSMADNQARAIKFAQSRMNEFKKYQTNKSLLDGTIYASSSDCREIGIRPADY